MLRLDKSRLKLKGFEYPSVSVMVTNKEDDQSVVTPSVQPNKDNIRNYGFTFEMEFEIKKGESLPPLVIQW